MTRFGFLALALFFVAAEGKCFTGCKDNCGTDEQSGSHTVLSGHLGVEIYRRTCTTCGHSTITVNTNPPAGAPGSLKHRLRYSCGGNNYQWQSLTGAGEIEVSLSGGPVTSSWSDVNVKNICGEDAAVEYYVTSSSFSDANVPVTVSIRCPQGFDVSGPPTAPGRVGARPTRTGLFAFDFGSARALAMTFR